jgi:hypothetical protein
MKTSVLVLLASLAGSPPAPVPLPNDVKTIHHLHHVYRHAQKAVEAEGIQPDAIAHPTDNFISSPRPSPFSDQKTDGLSRNPDDCSRYGCIDND